MYVRGYVTDSLEQGIRANITVQGATLGTVSNEQGFYEIGIPEADSVTLLFSCVGYLPRTRTFFTTQTNAYTVNVTLHPDAKLLDVVEVRALRRQATTMIQIELNKFRLMPDAAGGSIEALIKAIGSGVNSTNELSTQYSVRGGSYDENCVYVNGIEVYRPLLIRAGQQEGLSFINPDMVNSVEFSAGGFAAQYGDRMSSVLSVTYKQPQAFEAAVSASLLGASAYVGSTSGRFTQVHGIRSKMSQYLLGTMQTKGDYATWFVDYQTYMTYQLSPKWALSFLGNFSQNSYEFIPKSRTTEFGTIRIVRAFTVNFEGLEKDKFRTGFGALTLDFLPSARTKLSLLATGFSTSEQETYDIIGSYSLAEVDINNGGTEGDILGAGVYHEHARNRLSASVISLQHTGEHKWRNARLQWGAAFQREIIRDKLNEWEYRDSASYAIPTNPAQVEMVYNLTSGNAMFSSRLTAYLQDTYRHNASYGLWTFVVGIRANYWDFNRETLLSPRISAALFPKWKHDFNFRLAAGIYYQAPFYKEVRQTITDEQGNAHVVLNKDIRAQRAGNFVAGYDYFFRLWNRPFKFTAEAYYKPADRITTYAIDNVRVRYSGKNDAVAFTVGADLKLYGEFVPGTDSWIAISWMRAQEDVLNDSYKVYSNTGTYLGTVEPRWISRPNEQRYSVSLFFQDYLPNHPEYKVHLRLIWADGLPFGPPHGQRYEAVLRAKPYRRVDIGASRGFMQGHDAFMDRQKVMKALWLNLEFFNLFNIENTNSYYWITDFYNQQYAIPNYLTKFMVNVRLTVEF
jgi:hypothetical protein